MIATIGRYTLTILLGMLLTLAFAPWSYWPVAIFSLSGFLMLLQRANHARMAISTGFLFGFGFFGCAVSWVWISMHHYGNLNSILATLFTGFFVAYLSLYPAVFSYCVYRLKKHTVLFKWLMLPVIWVILEWLRSHLLSGFPWALLGYTTQTMPLAGYAPVLSVYGCSILMLLLCGSIAYWDQLKIKQRVMHILFAVLLLGAGYQLQQITWTTPIKTSYRVALVQGNIKQNLKWLSQHQQAIVDTYVRLSNPYWHQVDLMVWPESAITVPLPYSQLLIDGLTKQAAVTNTTLITGIPESIGEPHQQFFNSLLSVGMAGNQHYQKQHLVPFGEYVPFEQLLRGTLNFLDLPMSNFASGQPQQPPLQHGQLALKPAICYEMAYPEIVLNQPGSNALLTVSNDTWFGHSIGPHQHLQIASFRAMESQKPLLRATNSGITAIINHKGHITKKAQSFKEAVLVGNIYPRQGQTPAAQLGPHLLLLLLSGILILLAFLSNYPQGNKRAS